tara:strand:- start:906 stop:1562 length:657 start_codon:yes stop_codon:yes gene_type:complete
MLTGTLESNLVEYIQKEDIEGANTLLMKELANKLIDNRADFIELLNSNEIEADESMPKSQLIELFIDNTDNKSLLVGASLLANQQSVDVKSNFIDEEISDDSVKNGVAVMDTYFNNTIPDEEYSYIAPFLLGALARGAGKLIKGRVSQKDQDRVKNEYRRIAEQRMREQAALRQRAELERRQREVEKSKERKRTNTILIVSGAVVISLIVGVIIYKQR